MDTDKQKVVYKEHKVRMEQVVDTEVSELQALRDILFLLVLVEGKVVDKEVVPVRQQLKERKAEDKEDMEPLGDKVRKVHTARMVHKVRKVHMVRRMVVHTVRKVHMARMVVVHKADTVRMERTVRKGHKVVIGRMLDSIGIFLNLPYRI